MRRIALSALGFALLLSAIQLFSQTNATVEKTLESNEKAGWQAWKDHDAKQAVVWFTDDSVSIADGGVFKGKEQLVKSITDARCVVNSFSLSDFSYMWLDKDTVIMTYTGTQDATCDGKKQGGKGFRLVDLAEKRRQMVVAIPPGNRRRQHVAGDENSHPSSDGAWVGQAGI